MHVTAKRNLLSTLWYTENVSLVQITVGDINATFKSMFLNKRTKMQTESCYENSAGTQLLTFLLDSLFYNSFVSYLLFFSAL